MIQEAVVGVGEDEIAAGELPRDPVEPPAPPGWAVVGVAKNSGLLEVRDRYVGELPRHPIEPPAPPTLSIMGLDFGTREVIGAKDSIAKNSGLLEVCAIVTSGLPETALSL